jgi:3',5'-cyclic AMP phosphodiesterase CpdA
VSVVRLLHVSDLHFGRHSLPEPLAVIEGMIQRERFDAVVVSGDLTQRARLGEFARARDFLDLAAQVGPVLAVPGNHDCAWWRAPMHLAPTGWMFAKWRRGLGRDIEGVLRLPGVTVVGLNTAHGISRHTLTTRPRDLSVMGDLRPAQLTWAEGAFAASPPGDVRVVVMHHNPVRGEISGRHGLIHHQWVLGEFARMGVALVLCGHDHQEDLHDVEHPTRTLQVAVAGTITTRTRGGRPPAVNEVRVEGDVVTVQHRVWHAAAREFR